MTPALKRMRLVSLFSGIGAFEEGLKRAGVPYELVCYAETDAASSLSYSILHDVPLTKNWKDVAYLDGKSLHNVDMIVHGSPCQSFSRAGKNDGGEKDSGTASSLMWETVRIVEESLPKFVVWENVPDVISKKNIETFNLYLDTLGKTGYRSYFKIINAHDHKAAQKRRRMFVVSIRNDIEGDFHFPESQENPKSLMDYLEDNVGSAYTVPLSTVDQLVIGLITINNEIFYNIKNATKQGYLEAQEGDGIDWSYPTSLTRRGRVQIKSCQTLTTSCALGTIHNKIPRFFTPREYWRLQEFTDEQFDAVTKYGVTNNQLYRQAGNSINVNVTEALFRAMNEQGFIQVLFVFLYLK